ncbi:MAG: hypothetical protein JWP50_2579 [Phenylobacterium sp.]|nr:hypothetical protein [Phenylobacterium sp.]
MRIRIGFAAAFVAGAAAAQAPAPAPKSVPFEPGTQVDGAILQVMFGDRAVFRLDDGGKPVLDTVEKGKLAIAHPAGTVAETYVAPGPGLLAAAVDGSAETKATSLKVWNLTSRPVEYGAVVLVLQGGSLHPVPVRSCPVPAGGVRTETWPAPIVAVGLARFKTASKAALARCAAKKGK